MKKKYTAPKVMRMDSEKARRLSIEKIQRIAKQYGSPTGRFQNSYNLGFKTTNFVIQSQMAYENSLELLRKPDTLFQKYRKAFGLPSSDFVMEADYAEIETKVLAAYSQGDVDLSFMMNLSGMEMVANQVTWEPRLTCGKCGFRSTTSDMFHSHWKHAHKVLINRA